MALGQVHDVDVIPDTCGDTEGEHKSLLPRARLGWGAATDTPGYRVSLLHPFCHAPVPSSVL